MDKIKEFITARNIFIVIGFFIFIELIWAVWTLLKPYPVVTNNTPVVVAPNIASASLSLTADKTTLKKGEKFQVNINIFSSVKSPGVDVIVLYDPKVLTVETGKNGPVVVGTMFKDYPQNTLDNKNGRVTVSGISDISGGVLANGSLGSINFIAKGSGTVVLKIDFSPGSTVDSNITDVSGKDILSRAENTQINILP